MTKNDYFMILKILTKSLLYTNIDNEEHTKYKKRRP